MRWPLFVPKEDNRSVGISRKNERERQQAWLYDDGSMTYSDGYRTWAFRLHESPVQPSFERRRTWKSGIKWRRARQMIEQRKWVVCNPRQEHFFQQRKYLFFSIYLGQLTRWALGDEDWPVIVSRRVGVNRPIVARWLAPNQYPLEIPVSARNMQAKC
jgi:hypothetical protein